jgi:hypothetical protein
LKSISLKKYLPIQTSHSIEAIEAKVQNIQACPKKKEGKGTLVAFLNQKQYKNAKENTKHLPFRSPKPTRMSLKKRRERNVSSVPKL